MIDETKESFSIEDVGSIKHYCSSDEFCDFELIYSRK